MDCRNCRGPLSLDGTQNIVTCESCGLVSPPPESDDGDDRAAPLAIPSDSQCPRSHEQLAKSALDKALVKALVEQCGEGGGMRMTDGVFGAVVRHRRSTFQGTESRPTLLSPDLLNAERLKFKLSRPRGEEPMQFPPYRGPGNAVIDSCAACEFVWLDRGEMAVLELAPADNEFDFDSLSSVDFVTRGF
jgi:hypothetical protein